MQSRMTLDFHLKMAPTTRKKKIFSIIIHLAWMISAEYLGKFT